MKKILIFYASFGGGHLSAAKSIQNYLNENYTDIDIELIDCMKYASKPIEKISTSTYNQMAKNAPWAWGIMYERAQKGLFAHISNRTNAVLAIKLLKLLREKKPDIVISTHPFGTQMCNYLIKKNKIKFKNATILTDFRSHEQWVVNSEYTDLFFVSNEGMKKQLMDKNIPEKKIHITGIPVRHQFIKPHNKEEILKDLNFTSEKKTILLFGGGAFGFGKTINCNILESLSKNFTDVQVIAISGKNEELNKKFKEIVEKYNAQDRIKILEFTDKVAEYMSISSLILSKPGGLTTSESLISNVPMLMINPLPGQEEENAEFIESHNSGIWLRKHDNIDEVLNNLLNNEEKLSQMKEATKLIAHPNSTKDVCEIVLK